MTFVYSFGRAALLLLVEVYNHIFPVRERRRIRVKYKNTKRKLYKVNSAIWYNKTWKLKNIFYPLDASSASFNGLIPVADMYSIIFS